MYERGSAEHRPVISWLAWFIAVTAGMKALKGFLGVEQLHPGISAVLLNSMLCLALFCVRGNVADLFKSSDSNCLLQRLLRWQPKSKTRTNEVTQ